MFIVIPFCHYQNRSKYNDSYLLDNLLTTKLSFPYNESNSVKPVQAIGKSPTFVNDDKEEMV